MKNSGFKKAKLYKYYSLALIIALVLLFGVSIYQINKLSDRIEKVENKLGGIERINCSQTNTVNRVRRSVVRIVGGMAEGSGFAIQPGGFILTNFHVISSEPNPKVILPDNTFETGKVIMADKEADLAIVKIKKDIPVLEFSYLDSLNPAEELLAIGYPLGGVLPGDSFVIRGGFSRCVQDQENDVEYILTDMTLIEGISGGPLVNICGKVIGINTSRLVLGGMGLAISSDSILNKCRQMASSKEPLKDVKKIILQPHTNALESVRAFYSYLKARQLEKAFGLLSKRFKAGIGFKKWIVGYRDMLDTTIRVIRPDQKIANRIHVKLSSKDFVGDQIVYQYFEGYWDVNKIDGKWYLDDPEIGKIDNPDKYWFLDKYRVKAIGNFLEQNDINQEYAPEMYWISQQPGNENLSVKELYRIAKENLDNY